MTSKTFKCVEHEEEVLEVYPFTGEEGGRKFSLLMPHVSSNAGIAFDSTTAPALALAILEAAGVEAIDPVAKKVRFGTPENLGQIAFDLARCIREQEHLTAEAKLQAELEAEALELRNEYFNAVGSKRLWTDLNEDGHRIWLAVARKAREMAKEATK